MFVFSLVGMFHNEHLWAEYLSCRKCLRNVFCTCVMDNECEPVYVRGALKLLLLCCSIYCCCTKLSLRMDAALKEREKDLSHFTDHWLRGEDHDSALRLRLIIYMFFACSRTRVLPRIQRLRPCRSSVTFHSSFWTNHIDSWELWMYTLGEEKVPLFIRSHISCLRARVLDSKCF